MSEDRERRSGNAREAVWKSGNKEGGGTSSGLSPGWMSRMTCIALFGLLAGGYGGVNGLFSRSRRGVFALLADRKIDGVDRSWSWTWDARFGRVKWGLFTKTTTADSRCTAYWEMCSGAGAIRSLARA